MKPAKLSKPVFGWAMYDFANSAYSTSIVTVLFSVYFVKVLVPGEGVHLFGMTIPGESLWSYLVTLVMACVILFSPLLGAVADHKAAKRKFLLFFTIIGAVSTMSLLGASPGRLRWGMTIGFLSFLAFELAVIFYNAFLNDISTNENSGRISGLGFAFGYIGGGVCLALNLLMIKKPDLFGLESLDPTLPIRSAFFVVGLWWLIFSIPTFLWVKDRPQLQKRSDPALTVLRDSLRQLRATFQLIKKMKELKRFLLAYLIYNDGIQTLLIMSSIIGAQVLGMSMSQLALCILLIQFVAFFGAMFFGWLADRWSHKKAILVTLVVYLSVTIWASLMTHQWEFWALGVIVGVVLGGSQSATRSLYSLFIPRDKTSEFFSFYAMVGKAAALIGPLSFGVVTQNFGLRVGIAGIAFFYVVGGLILLTVDERQGIKFANQIPPPHPNTAIGPHHHQK